MIKNEYLSESKLYLTFIVITDSFNVFFIRNTFVNHSQANGLPDRGHFRTERSHNADEEDRGHHKWWAGGERNEEEDAAKMARLVDDLCINGNELLCK